MKLDQDFQENFFAYLESLSKEEIINVIEMPSVNVDFLTNIMPFNNINDMHKYYSIRAIYHRSFFRSNRHFKTKNHYQDIYNAVLNKKEHSVDNNIIEEEYAIAANENRYAIAA